MNLQKAIAKVNKQRRTGQSKPLSAWGLECNLAFVRADKIQDKLINAQQDRLKDERRTA
jgi:hypothetical protein